MSRIKRLFLLVTMILMTVILDATVYADEPELHYLDVLVTKNDMPLLIKKDSYCIICATGKNEDLSGGECLARFL